MVDGIPTKAEMVQAAKYWFFLFVLYVVLTIIFNVMLRMLAAHVVVRWR